MCRSKPWEVSDALWERVAPLIPQRMGKQKAGRPAKSDRQMLGAILYVLRTGLQWNALPRESGASTTVYDRFRFWEQAEFFQRLWAAVMGSGYGQRDSASVTRYWAWTGRI